MPRTSHDVSDTELAILQVLWDGGAAPIRRIADVLYPDGGFPQYTTVQKLLGRLEAKGLVARDRTLHVHLFSATIGRDEMIGLRLRDVAEQLCGGSLSPLLTHLARAEALTGDQWEELRAFVEATAPPADDPGRPEGKEGRR